MNPLHPAVLSLLLAVPALAGDEGTILRSNERTLEQVLKAYAEIPPVQYSPPNGGTDCRRRGSC